MSREVVTGACAALAAFGLLMAQETHPCVGKTPVQCAEHYGWSNLNE